ncbi:MAG: Glu-tRNA(Gln) amidotransferase subunit GatE [Candidatus Odinarchaeum yellowstonii]|uniref:Glutamyl-tRNA(Gln) amidotransferase subunit E n=1 Tax=Odinarchaeota yellowstonii (strain LCB_4) TaxID=1841599 RepID=A0AAF0IAP4_ODILC|nr:MAG: Glu-tRNA(Gln) amidotransferase subunit GatE [Candidatus Odinarchaeum yellowstonii]
MLSKGFDYRQLGFKAGLEIHQELNLDSKLFCKCPNILQKGEPDFIIKRFFRPVMGEMGEFDKAMLTEYEKNKTVVYEGFYQSTCTYELDETPPLQINEEAVNTGLTLTLLLKATPVDELHVCRKNYLDGSVTCGFQRTVIIGLNGMIPIKNKNVPITSISIEEDAARKISEENGVIRYRLDRLGIPLVELVTAPVLENPDEIYEAAYRLGLLLRATGKAKRGIGTIRQDINLSIEGGARVELKGVQKLEWINRLVEAEIQRQLSLIEIKKALLERGGSPETLVFNPVNLSKIFENTKCKLVSTGLKQGKQVLGIRLPFFKGLLGRKIQLDKSFGFEIADKVNAITGLKGIIHSDEQLSKYGFEQSEIDEVNLTLGLSELDAFALVVGDLERANKAVKIIVDRCRSAYGGVPLETRRVLEDGSSRFEREIHGGARLYPDTDTPPIKIGEDKINSIKGRLPSYPWEVEKTYSEKYGLPVKVIRELILDDKIDLFIKIVDELSIDPTLVSKTLIETVKALQRENPSFKEISDDKLFEIFKTLKAGRISKEAVEEVMRILGSDEKLSLDTALDKLGLRQITVEELDTIIRECAASNLQLIRDKGERAFAPLMGEVMKKVRGRIDGRIVSERLKKEINRIVGE